MKMKADQPKSPKFYTIEQIAECVDASTRTVRRWIEKRLWLPTGSTGWFGFPRRISWRSGGP